MRRFLRVRWNDLLAAFYLSLAAIDAIWPASEVMNTFKLFISDRFEKSPVSTALRSAAITAAVSIVSDPIYSIVNDGVTPSSRSQSFSPEYTHTPQWSANNAAFWDSVKLLERDIFPPQEP